jgi:hypothetical protein
MELFFTPKNAEIFFCEKCLFKCSKLSDWKRHVSTRKHKMELIGINKKRLTKIHVCKICKKEYSTQSGLWKHKNKCVKIEEKPKTTNDVIESLIEKNNEIHKHIYDELKNTLSEIIPKIQPIVTNNNNTTNNIVNINIFLNEHCKDAMNINEFIDSIQFTMDHMLNIGVQGQAKGIANVIVDKLNELDFVKRPLHCSDLKKETIYIKDEDVWQKEGPNKPKLKQAIENITRKTFNSLSCLEEDPDSYVKTVTEIVKDPIEDKKIISEIAKNINIHENMNT